MNSPEIRRQLGIKEDPEVVPQVQRNIFLLALREHVVFPNIRTSINLNGQTFTRLCEHLERHQTNEIGVISVQTDKRGDDAKRSDDDIFEIGTFCKLISHSQSNTSRSDSNEGTATIIVHGKSRFRVVNSDQTQPYRMATIELMTEEGDNDDVEVKELESAVQQSLLKNLKPNIGHRGGRNRNAACLTALLTEKEIQWPHSSSLLADMIGFGLGQLTMTERQKVLATIPVKARLQLVLNLISMVGAAQQVEKEINSNIRARSQEELRETVLRRQMDEIQKEMRKLKNIKKTPVSEGDSTVNEDEEEQSDEEDDIAALKRSLSQAGLSTEAQKIAKRELKRLQSMQPQHPEHIVCRTYLETLAGLPWNKSSNEEQNLDLNKVRDILEADHHGLEVVKHRILEFFAVNKLRGDMKGPILCLHGPPGVGKTSLGKSIAKALGREFHRIALGGVRDEAELRGHRRTYIGSMPGVIIQSLIASKVNNPVVLLDEVDKLTTNNTFNPSGALLEILDPEQNSTFKDNYINCAFDLSKTIFICTCNEVQPIDRPLLDRMEVIDLSGYTVEEKVAIAERHLIPKQLRTHALFRKVAQDTKAANEDDIDPAAELKEDKEELGDPLLVMRDSTITDLVSKWTAESGVRSLERKVAQVCRWAALRMISGPSMCVADGTNKEEEEEKERALAECGPDENGVITIDSRHLPHIVGVQVFDPDLAERLTTGVAMGLGVTGTGGQLLFVEATRHKGSGRLTITGQLGEVMRESVMAAVTLLKSKADTLLVPKTDAASESDDASTGYLIFDGPPRVTPRDDSTPSPVTASGGQSSRLARKSSDSRLMSPIFGFGLPGRNLGDSSNPSEQVTKQVQTLFSHLGEKSLLGSEDVHVHFPAGGIPKDGPSAGVTATLALASLLFGRPVRSDTAVTGEITLRGHVLPVGGIKDKVLAAHRAGVKHVLLPHANMRHAAKDLPASVVKDIQLHFVKHVDEALYWMFSDETDSDLKVTPFLSKL